MLGYHWTPRGEKGSHVGEFIRNKKNENAQNLGLGAPTRVLLSFLYVFFLAFRFEPDIQFSWYLVFVWFIIVFLSIIVKFRACK